MKKLLIFSACLGALGSTSALAQTAEPDVVLVKATIRAGYRLSVTRQGKTTIVAEFGSSQLEKQRDLPEGAAQALYAQLFQEGYNLKGTYGASSQFGSDNWLIFSKGQ